MTENRLAEPDRELVRSGPFADRLPDPPGMTLAERFGHLRGAAWLAMRALKNADLDDTAIERARTMLAQALDQTETVMP